MQKPFGKPNRLLKYLITAILLVVPLYPKFPFITVPGTYVSIRLEDFLMAFSIFFLAVLVYPKMRRFFTNNVNLSVFIFLLTALVSLGSAVLVTQTVLPQLGFLHWARRVEYIIPFFLGVFALRGKGKDLEYYLKVIMIALIILFIYGFGQKNFNWPIIITQNPEYAQGIALRYVPGSHINSSFAGHYDLGTFLVLLLPIFICLFFLVKDWRTKVYLFLVTSAGLWLLAYSGSRISSFSYLVAASSALFLIKRYKYIPVVVFFSFLFFSMSPNLMARYTRIIEVSIARVKSLSNSIYFPKQKIAYAQEGIILPERRPVATPTPTPQPVFEDRSTSIRLNVEWPRAIRAFSKNPLLGTGYSSITLATDNDFLRLLGETGVLGFLAFFLIFIRIAEFVKSAYPFDKNYSGIKLAFVAGTVGSIPGIFLNAVFLDIFEASKFAIIFWLVMGMLLASVKRKYYE
ncbi:MAG: O-antigen ligase family protein [Patescibacteria group bacterium]